MSHQQTISRQNKVHVSTATAIALRQAALRRNTSISDVVRKLVETHLEAPTNGDCMVETNKSGGRVSAAYLSNALADCVRDLCGAERLQPKLDHPRPDPLRAKATRHLALTITFVVACRYHRDLIAKQTVCRRKAGS